ncbi:MAG: ATP-binding protein [Candidatus Levyibacteriota bacterium]
MQTILLIIGGAILFFYVVHFLAKRLRKTEEELKHKNAEFQKRLYELSIAQAVSTQIGYSLDIKAIAESIVSTAQYIMNTSIVSYALVDHKTITLKLFQKDFVPDSFVSSFKESTLQSLYEKLPHDSYRIIEAAEREILKPGEHSDQEAPQTFLAIPIVINSECVGVISLSSFRPNAFSKEDKELVVRIIDNTTAAVGRLEDVIATEKSKLDSFLFSVTSGAILFLIDGEVLRLSAINSAAKQFLHIEDDHPDTTSVIARFGMHYDLVKNIQDIAKDKKSMIIKDVSIYERSFKIYLNPVFLRSEEKIIGVAVTMEDVTFERDIEKMRETFTSMVVHELRAPLSSIKGASSMLLKGSLKVEDEKKMLQIIYDSTDRMLTEIGDILDMSKLEAGKFTLNKSLGELNKLVDEKVLAFSFTAQERHVTITSGLDTAIGQTVFDNQRIGQVLNNLLSNALKFTPDNGSIKVSTNLSDGQITVSVADTGVGIPESKIPLLFSKYGQLSGAIRKEGGTGLGLYISKGIIESHGGKISVISTSGKGTTFTFTIPAVTTMEEAAPVAAPVPSSQLSGQVVN